MDWNCILTEDRLTDFFDGVLSREQVRTLSAHCAACTRCPQLVAQVSGLLSQMRGLEPVEEPPQLVAKILYLTLGRRAPGQGHMLASLLEGPWNGIGARGAARS